MRYLIRFWASISFALTLFGVFWIPKNVADWEEAALPWRQLFSIVNQNTALWAFAIVALAYVVWMDVRPAVRAQLRAGRVARSYQHKLVSAGHFLSSEDLTRRAKKLFFQRAMPVIPLENRADFPIYFRFESLRYSVNDEIVCEDNVLPELAMIQPGQSIQYTCRSTDWSQIPVEDSTVHVEFVLRYGDEKYQPCTLKRKFTITTRERDGALTTAALDHPIAGKTAVLLPVTPS